MEAGSYGYGLNVALAARTDALAENSKRVERDFRLTSITCALSDSTSFDDGFAVILGTEHQDWFGSWVICSVIFGDGALPHFLPGNGTIITKGDFIVAKTRNMNTSAKRLAFLFQGVHL